MNTFINRVMGRLEYLWTKNRLNLFATLYINFRTLPFSQACKLPIYIYGRVKFYNLNGDIIINAPVRRGMIKFGIMQGYFTASKRCAMIFLTAGSKLIFNGPCKFDSDYVIRITGGTVSIGAYVRFGNDVKICSENSITIGDFCGIPFGSCFMDTNFHYTINTQTGSVHTKSVPIVIGARNWIGNTTTVMKGTRTPDCTLIASKSFLNKDYIRLGNQAENILLAGSPAKIVAENCARVFSKEMAVMLDKWFKEHPDETVYQDEKLLSSYGNTDRIVKMFE